LQYFENRIFIKRKKIVKLKIYVLDVYKELVEKVNWPTWNELQNSAIVVMITSLIFALIILTMDEFFRNLMKIIYDVFGEF